jgi:DNA invertase Pin-like site-specific DNA recombinase
MSTGDQEPAIYAAAYVRMSTDHQEHSPENQMAIIREYAERRGIQIVKTYTDEGKSGLSVQGRDSLGQLLNDVRGGQVNFTCILVLDVSRWGRFQDPDEAAYHEFICRQAGIAVHYCAEQFENDGSPTSSVFKVMKRTMAGEYSRELSSKVFHGACRLIQLGYKQGGTAGFGLRRMLIDQAGQRKALLKMGEHKSIQTDRVILVPGPDDEVKTVKCMYEMFVEEGKSEADIAEWLNGNCILTDFGRVWTRGTVHEVLTNEKYIGNNIYHRTSFKLKRKHVVNPPDKWVRGDGKYAAIVEREVFFKAQEIIQARSRKFTDAEMLDLLRSVLQKHGHICGILIDEIENAPSSGSFRHRFGSLVTAYKLIGYDPQIDYAFIEINRRLRQQHPALLTTVIHGIESLGANAQWNADLELLNVNNEFRVSIVLCRHTFTKTGFSRWLIRLDEALKPDITVAVRMDEINEGIRDYYLLPALDMTWGNLRLAEENGIYLDAYRFDTLDYFLKMTERIKILEAA